MSGAASIIIGGSGLLGSTFEQIRSEVEANKQRQQALKLRLAEEKVASNQRKIQTENQVNRVMASQVAGQAASGFALSSPSFGAIQVDSLNKAADDINADNLNFQFQKTTIEQAKASSEGNRNIGVGKSLFNAGETIAFAFASGGKIPGPGPFAAKAIPKGSSAANQEILGATKEDQKATDDLRFFDPFKNLS